MRHPPLNQLPLGVRVWRAVAIGFSSTALGLNALWPSLIHREASAAAPSALHRVQPARHTPAMPEAAQPSRSRTGMTAPDDGPAAAALAHRFSDAKDADLSELATALAALGGPAAHAALFTAARSSRPSSRSAALEALATVDTPDVRELMIAQLSGPDPQPAVIDYFADCLEPRALPALERLAREASTELRSHAVASLFAQGEGALPILSRLVQADGELADALLDVTLISARARRVLRRASVQRVRAGAITQGRVFDFLERDLSPEARDALLDAAHEPASVERAIAALSNRGDRASLDALRRLGNDTDRSLAARATCALRALTGSSTHPVPRRYRQ